MTTQAISEPVVELTLEGPDGKLKAYRFTRLTRHQLQAIRERVYQEIRDGIAVIAPDLEFDDLSTRQKVNLFSRPHTLFLRARDASDLLGVLAIPNA